MTDQVNFIDGLFDVQFTSGIDNFGNNTREKELQCHYRNGGYHNWSARHHIGEKIWKIHQSLNPFHKQLIDVLKSRNFAFWLRKGFFGSPDYYGSIGRRNSPPKKLIQLWESIVKFVSGNRKYFATQVLLCDFMDVKHPFSLPYKELPFAFYKTELEGTIQLNSGGELPNDYRLWRCIDDCGCIEFKEKQKNEAFRLILCSEKMQIDRNKNKKKSQSKFDFGSALSLSFNSLNVKTNIVMFALTKYVFTMF